MGTGKQGGRALYTFDLVLILSGILEMGCKAKGADCFLDLDQRVGLRDWDNWEIFFLCRLYSGLGTRRGIHLLT
jgi:hypothetical protein